MDAKSAKHERHATDEFMVGKKCKLDVSYFAVCLRIVMNISLPPPIYIYNETGFNEMVKQLRDDSVIGFDCERESTTFESSTVLLQISTRKVDFIVFTADIDAITVCGLNDITSDNNILKIIHDCRQDAKHLYLDFGFKFNNIFDTQAVAECLKETSKYSDLLQRYCGIDVSYLKKKYQRYDWSQRPYEPCALLYAQLDSHFLIDVHQKLVEAVDNSDDSIALQIKIKAETTKRLTQMHQPRRYKNKCGHILNMHKHTFTDSQKEIFQRAHLWRYDLSKSLGISERHICIANSYLDLFNRIMQHLIKDEQLLELQKILFSLNSNSTTTVGECKPESDNWQQNCTYAAEQNGEVILVEDYTRDEDFLARDALEDELDVPEYQTRANEHDYAPDEPKVSFSFQMEQDYNEEFLAYDTLEKVPELVPERKRGRKRNRKINFNLFICSLHWNCHVRQIVQMFTLRKYPKPKVNMILDKNGDFTGLAYVYIPNNILSKLLDDHFRRPFCITKNHPLKMRRMIHSNDKLIQCTISYQIKIIFAPLCNGISRDIVQDWFNFFGKIIHVNTFYCQNLERTVAIITYENHDSVDRIIASHPPLDPLFIEHAEKLEKLKENDERLVIHQKRIERAKQTRHLYHQRKHDVSSYLLSFQKVLEMKAKKISTEFENVLIYPGEFHIMKNMMILVWDVLQGTGIEDIIGELYKAAALRSILNVHHFNKSLRSCKLIYTALSILIMEEFLKTSPSTAKIKSMIAKAPNEHEDRTSELQFQWFQNVLDEMRTEDLANAFAAWAVGRSQQNLTFKFWYFVLEHLFKPLMELYMSIRTSNFSTRNSSLSKIAPLFFANNHRNYARLFAQHFVDLRSCSKYLLERLERSFAVNRTNRPFSSIAMDQTIECTINKVGKGYGGISGRFDEQSIDTWTKSFAFRALLSTVTCEIASLETSKNEIASHLECQPNRSAIDNKDLTTIISKLRPEKLFESENQHCRKLLSGKIIHEDIVDNICSSFEKGLDALKTYTQERLVTKSVALDLIELFSYEYTDTPLSLCDKDNFELINQQNKASAMDFMKEKFSTCFTGSYQTNYDQCALVIDGGSLLEIMPSSKTSTVHDYAVQLLQNVIIQQLKSFQRIDIVFDSSDSKAVKAFTKRHANNKSNNKYDLKKDDRLATKYCEYHDFVHQNRAILAKCVLECWQEPALVNLLPERTVLVVAGPAVEAVRLQKNLPPETVDELEANHVEADTRMMLHIQAIQSTYIFNKVVIQASDTDVVLLSVAYAKIIGLDSLVVKCFNTTTKVFTYVDSMRMAEEIIEKYRFDPILLIILHALSGCDTTS
ncbi:unnamed protein product, partial [Didymodactylos carnosus]